MVVGLEGLLHSIGLCFASTVLSSDACCVTYRTLWIHISVRYVKG